MGIKVFKSIREEYDYYIDTFKSELNSEEKEEFNAILDNRDKYIRDQKEKEKKVKFPIESLRKVNKSLEDNKKIINSIFSSEYKIEKAKQFSIVAEMKQVYYNYFRSYYNQKKSKVGDLFKPVFQRTSNYDQMLIEQSNFEEYLRIRGIYFEKNGKHRVSAEFRKDMIEIIRLENSNKEECTEYLARRFKEKFDMDLQYTSVSFLSENITQFYELCLQEEQTILRNKQETKSSNYNNYSDSGSGSGGGSDGGSDGGNRYHTSYKSSSYSSSSSSRSNNSYKSGNSSKNTSNKKKRVKVIMCYACKGKNKCPLCGDKMNSKVSLGNLYAHSDCYNEGTCCLCNKKGSGNQVQSICSDCRKNGNGKGLTGSAKCFVCRKLIN